MRRRELLLLGAAALPLATRASRAVARARVVVVGGGYGGATAAKYLRLFSRGAIEVVLVEPEAAFVSCPMSNLVLAGRWGLAIAIGWSVVSLVVAALTGPWVLAATALGLAGAWAYSAPPLRFKTSGWVGPAVVAFCYEGLSWFTGAAVMAGALPSGRVLALLCLYSLGAHGIMTLNDFKAVTGDRVMGLRSLPVVLGERRAALLASVVMAVPQMVVVVLLSRWGMVLPAVAVAVMLAAQLALMPRLVADPARRAPWYNATGVSLYVLGMMAAALGLGGYL